jgi:protein phosphatase
MEIVRNLFGKGEDQRAAELDNGYLSVGPLYRRLQAGWATDTGELRSHNEDTILVVTAACEGDSVTSEFGLFVLADGMGGHRAGEVASSLAARVAVSHVVRQFYLPGLVSEDHTADQTPLNDVLVDAVQAANLAVTQQVPGSGTTLTSALILGRRVYIAHVGDSRAYIIGDDGLDQITHDHSVVDRLVDMGHLTRGEAAIHPHRNVLYRALGQDGPLEVDTYVRTLPAAGTLMLCTDGLWGMVEASEILDVVRGAPSLQAGCEALVAAANRAGGRDNITVVLAQPSD